MVDATTGHEALSFMDGFSGYNQIRMNPKDEELTAFRTPKGIYCYKVMPFGLKNAGATYQQAIQKIFDNVLHKYMECYVDDLVVKTKRREDHLIDLRSMFNRLRKYQLRMNPRKCAFGVTSGKFLGFVVRHRDIEIDQSKIEAIQKMPEPKNLQELRGLQGKLAYIRRFISNLAGRCQPFNRLMKKDVHFEWDEACSNAFARIKRYLLNPQVLGAPILGKPLVLYIAAQEKSLDKLEYYMQAYTVRLIAKADPIKYVLSRPVVSGRIARWAVLLQQYDIAYVPQKVVKGQALADFLVDHPGPSDWEFSDDFPDEDVFYIEVIPPWMMFFDGTARREGAGAGVVFVSPQRQILLYSFSLSELCSNNVAEYQTLIIGLQMAIEMSISQLEIFGDSKLVINQILEQYDVKKEDLIPYCQYAKKLLTNFEVITLEHIPRKENKQADALANLATALALSQEETTKVAISQRWVVPLMIEEEEEEKANIISWAEAIPLREVKKETIVNFVRTHLIYRYGVPRYIITDNGKPFYNRLMTELCEKFEFKQYNSSMYNASANGLAVAFNKTLGSLLKKVVSKTKESEKHYGHIGQHFERLLKRRHILLSMEWKLSFLWNVKSHHYGLPFKKD
nr:uncharacterized protein LOC112027322 [Quercus suber]